MKAQKMKLLVYFIVLSLPVSALAADAGKGAKPKEVANPGELNVKISPRCAEHISNLFVSDIISNGLQFEIEENRNASAVVNGVIDQLAKSDYVNSSQVLSSLGDEEARLLKQIKDDTAYLDGLKRKMGIGDADPGTIEMGSRIVDSEWQELYDERATKRLGAVQALGVLRNSTGLLSKAVESLNSRRDEIGGELITLDWQLYFYHVVLSDRYEHEQKVASQEYARYSSQIAYNEVKSKDGKKVIKKAETCRTHVDNQVVVYNKKVEAYTKQEAAKKEAAEQAAAAEQRRASAERVSTTVQNVKKVITSFLK